MKKRGSDAVPLPEAIPLPDSATFPPDTTDGSTYDLAKLNRHWYRRCLDSLGRTLNAGGTSPSVEELQELCDNLITSFLTAVTGQSPDSDRSQFPADRAYYIPFAGDRAGKFNFAKPYFQMLGQPPDYPAGTHETLWSFLPWAKSNAGSDEYLEPSIVDSLDSTKQATLSFSEFLKRQASNVTEKKDLGRSEAPFRLRKSVLIRGKNDGVLSKAISNLQKPDRDLKKNIACALLGIFDVYKAFPGNAAIELLLLNHFQLLRWLWQCVTPTTARAGETAADDGGILRQVDIEAALFHVLLRAYFGVEPADVEDPWNWVCELDATLPQWVIAVKEDTPFRQAVGQRQRQAYRSTEEKESKPNKARLRNAEAEDHYALELKELRPQFTNFRDLILAAKTEERLESDLAAAATDDPRRAGTAKRSFVWVCADFQQLMKSLPEGFDPRDTEIVKEAEKQLADVVKPYRSFFQELEAESLSQEHSGAIGSYWRTRGDAARAARVFGSYQDKTRGTLAFPPPKLLDALRLTAEEPRPQNIFLRVRICDSLNEPMIDGLFVFTTDHDEVVNKGKDPNLRRQDIEDLLAFGKVFFFIVRDHLHGLDRARESADIGRLNQHLYDRRLAELDKCMNQRLLTEAFQRDGASKPEHWSLFTYEVLNNFAYSLIEKPEDVRNETFPFDRLLVVPLPERRARDGDHAGNYDLPFYLFQALYVECNDQKIQKGKYSLLKPFQSPVEEFDETSEDVKRFHARSFQEVSDAGGRKRRLSEYLQKHYVGAEDPGDGENVSFEQAVTEPASYVVKAAPSPDGKRDNGTEWTQWAFRRFWSRTKEDAALWNGFLCDLTESYRALIRDKAAVTDQDRLWFLCRYGLLQAVLHFMKAQSPDDEHFKTIQKDYARELSLRFGGTKDLDILSALISEKGVDPVEVLEQNKLMPDGPGQIAFVDYLLNTQDRWVLEFLQTLTELVCGKTRKTREDDQETHEQNQCYETYFQDLLTRPGITGGVGAEAAKHRLAAEQIGNRIPPYEEIATGSDTIATFLGILSLTVGTTDLERRRLRCIIVMMRDYDDTKTGRVQSESEARKRLEVDRSDLTLYTRTFFQNVHRFLTTARERQQVRVLSTDITQIARSWYSRGIDFVVTSLLNRLHELVEGPETQKLGRLRPEIIDCAFLSLLNVMIRQEKRRDGIRDIELESFPFDRFLHIPLLLGPTAAARWCYARTDFDSSPNSVKRYERILLEGRHVLLRGGKKIIAPPSPVYLGPGEFFSTSGQGRKTVRNLLGKLAEPSLLDRFVRRLNETHALQTLAVSGTIYHLLKQRDVLDRDGDLRRGGIAGAERVAKELRGVIERSVRSLEREGGPVIVLTEAHMDRPVSIGKAASKANGAPDGEGLLELFGNVKSIPYFHEIFAAVEGPDYEYGLSGEGSKIFYVYYSIPAPDGFIERDELDSRYRGLYCLIVDQAKTDDKKQPEDDGLSDAEAADLDDIRTFVHNAMCSLGQVLGQQALQHRLLKPGVAQDILGMMHRLKNELNGPVSTLSNMKRALATPELIPEHTRELTNDLDSADGTIMGIDDLFHNMKRLSEFEHGNIPLQTFSSDWLAWTFVVKLCQSCIKAIGKQRGFGSENAATREINKICDDAKVNVIGSTSLSDAPRSAKAHESTNAIESVQKALFNLAKVFGCEYASPAETKVEFIFGFEAFTVDKPLEFRGSYLLDEALDTLIDNAFQALLACLETKIQAQEPNVVGRMRLICRQDEENDDEILLELRNSSNALAPRLIEELNADPPRTVSAAIHAEVSGKKGGSGFGHYFARRIVSEYCGGRQARRQLDVQIKYEAGLARTRLRLLKSRLGGVRAIAAEDLSRALTSEYKDAADLTRNLRLEDGAGYSLPSELQLRGVLRTLREALSEGLKMKFDELFHFVEQDLGSELMAAADTLRDGLIASLEKATSEYPELSGIVNLLRDPSECRNGSLHDVHKILKAFSVSDPNAFDVITNLLKSEGGRKASLAQPLENMGRGASLNPWLLLHDDDRKGLTGRFQPLVPFLTPVAARRGLEALADSIEKFEPDIDGIPIPKQRVLAERFCKQRLTFELSNTDSGMMLDIWSSIDSDECAIASDFKAASLKELSASDLCRLYARNMLGRTVAQHQDAFRSDEPIGSLRLFESESAPPVWRAQLILAAWRNDSTNGVEDDSGQPV